MSQTAQLSDSTRVPTAPAKRRHVPSTRNWVPMDIVQTAQQGGSLVLTTKSYALIWPQKYVVVLTVLITEEIKQKQSLEKLARHGLFIHLNIILVITRLQFGLMLVWMAIIAEIQMVQKANFGATQWIQIQDTKIVTQLAIHEQLIVD